jgi:hypothetical protein
MLSNYFPIKFDSINICNNEPLWKQILGLYIYEWDSTPQGMTIRILGFNIDFLLGRWTEE